jgi:hypothetical protein
VPLGFHHSQAPISPQYDRYTPLSHFFGFQFAIQSGPRSPPPPKATLSIRWSLPGLRAQGGSFRKIDYEQIVVSFRFLLTFLALIPATGLLQWTLRTRRRTQRSLHGRCINCNYDLRASKDRCPECNHPIPTPQNPPPTPPPVEADSSS